MDVIDEMEMDREVTPGLMPDLPNDGNVDHANKAINESALSAPTTEGFGVQSAKI